MWIVDLDSAGTQGNPCADTYIEGEMTTPRRPIMLLCALAAVLTLGCQSGGGDDGPATAEEAHRFVEAAEARLRHSATTRAAPAGSRATSSPSTRRRSPPTRRASFAAAVSELARGARRFEQTAAALRRRAQAQAAETAALGARAGQQVRARRIVEPLVLARRGLRKGQVLPQR